MNVVENLIRYADAYPKMQPRDLLKYAFHSCFGCDHMITPDAPVEQRIQAEWESLGGQVLTEVLPGGKYGRVHLGWLGEGLSARTLGRIFRLSAKKEENGKAELEELLAQATAMVKQGAFGFDEETFVAELRRWREENYPAIHHSEAFRQVYCPTYRVVSGKFLPYLSLFAAIDRGLSKGRMRLAIEGGSASGKTTLASMLQEVYDCAVVHTDDFFLQPHQRTEERLAQPGGNLDRERLAEEVLAPLFRQSQVCYRPFDCGTMSLGAEHLLPDKALTVIEGAYSMHPELAKFYDFAVFLEITPQEQTRRVLKRNSPTMAKRYLETWIPMENRYFECFDIRQQCALIL